MARPVQSGVAIMRLLAAYLVSLILSADTRESCVAILRQFAAYLVSLIPSADTRGTHTHKHTHTMQVLFIYLEPGTKDKYTAQRVPPTNFKTKCIYITKNADTIPDNEFEALLNFSEFGAAPLPMILALAQEVYFPLLTNPRNQEGWPEVITKEVQESLHRFVAQVYITIGNTQGITMLPLPPNHGAAIIDNTGRDKDRIHVLESAVVMWTKQIKGILKQDPETALKSGHPGPEVELEFWRNKAENLNSLHVQLSGEKIRKVVKVLEVTKSTYFPAFNRLCKEVAQARMEVIMCRHFDHTCLISDVASAITAAPDNSCVESVLRRGTTL